MIKPMLRAYATVSREMMTKHVSHVKRSVRIEMKDMGIANVQAQAIVKPRASTPATCVRELDEYRPARESTQ